MELPRCRDPRASCGLRRRDRRASNDSTNLRYEFCNAMMWLGTADRTFPKVFCRRPPSKFPDPWFKKKHAKRRMVNAELVDCRKQVRRGRTDLCPDGHRVFRRGDVRAFSGRMPDLTEIRVDENPFPVKTEREKAVEDKGPACVPSAV